jgi:hypothetical protein
MIKNIKSHLYIIGGIVVFFILFFVGVFGMRVSWGESLLGSAVISFVGVVGIWWKQEIWP